MDEKRGEKGMTGADLDALRYFRLHARVYALGAAVLFLFDLVVSGGWWFFWPVFGWGILVLLHYLYLKSIRVDSDWAEDRTTQIIEKAYDVGHIQDIRQRYEGASPPVRGGDKAED
jgi:hypothetical protein